MRRSVIGMGVVAAVAVSAVSAQAAQLVLAPSRAHAFRSPDGNIVCAYTPPVAGQRASMRCDVLRTSAGRRVAARFTPIGRARLFRPVDMVALAGRQRALREGTVVAVGAFRCTYAAASMVCMSVRSPYGFALGAKRQAPL